MSTLTSVMKRDPQGNELALALFDLAVAERVNPPTERDLDRWETMRGRDEDKLPTLFKPDDYRETEGIFYHGTSGDWAGLPIPAPDKPSEENEVWPTAIFVSPYIGHARTLADWKIPKRGRIRQEPRIWVGALDADQIYKPIEAVWGIPSDYGEAIRWTNEQLRERATEFDYPAGYAGIMPPYYEDYEEDEGQVLVLDPFALRWVDIALGGDLSVRGARELGGRAGFEWIGALDRHAQQAADRLVARTPTQALRLHQWHDDRRAVGDVIQHTRWPAISGNVDPYVDLNFPMPHPTSYGAGEDWGRLANQAIMDARAASPSGRDAAMQRLADIREYAKWLAAWRQGVATHPTHPANADQILTWRLPQPHEFDRMPNPLKEGLITPMLALTIEIEMAETREVARRLNQTNPLTFEVDEHGHMMLSQADRERLAAMTDDQLVTEIAAAQPIIPKGISDYEAKRIIHGWKSAIDWFLWWGMGENSYRYFELVAKLGTTLTDQGHEMLPW